MLKEKLGKERVFFDGAMATTLYQLGLKQGDRPELFNFQHPKLVEEVHKGYLRAGSNIISTNTFGANRYRLEETEYSVDEVIKKAITIAKEATKNFNNTYIALDIGSTGKCLMPKGEVTAEELYEVFKEQVIAGVKYGCDLILLETFMSSEELELAILAVKRNTHLPIMCTMSFDSCGKTFYGTSLEEMIAVSERLKVDAIGMNCFTMSKEFMSLIKKLIASTDLPVIIQPNVGLPMRKEGKITYPIKKEAFSQYMKELNKMGVCILGGCCGTTAEYIKEMIDNIEI